jgi:hypothetical protein
VESSGGPTESSCQLKTGRKIARFPHKFASPLRTTTADLSIIYIFIVLTRVRPPCEAGYAQIFDDRYETVARVLSRASAHRSATRYSSALQTLARCTMAESLASAVHAVPAAGVPDSSVPPAPTSSVSALARAALEDGACLRCARLAAALSTSSAETAVLRAALRESVAAKPVAPAAAVQAQPQLQPQAPRARAATHDEDDDEDGEAGTAQPSSASSSGADVARRLMALLAERDAALRAARAEADALQEELDRLRSAAS